jgi:hypothetical protein
MYWTKINDTCFLTICKDCEVRLEMDEGRWHFGLLPNAEKPAAVEGFFHPSWRLERCKRVVETICEMYARWREKGECL